MVVEETHFEASEREIETSNINDVSEDFLSKEQLNYYFNLVPHDINFSYYSSFPRKRESSFTKSVRKADEKNQNKTLT